MKTTSWISMRNCNARPVRFGLVVLFALAVAASGRASNAAEWKPEKAVEIIVPTSPGGGQDTLARIIQRIVQDRRLIEATMTVVNKAGGGEAVAYGYLNQHPKDGHYLAIATVNLLTNRITGSNPLNYADVTPIALMVNEYLVFVVRADSPVKNGKDFVERLKKDPSALSIGVGPSLGGSSHISAGLVAKVAGIDARRLKVVVFASGGEIMTAVLGGHVDVSAASMTASVPHLQSGKMRAIGVPSPQRLGGPVANVPTWREQGFDAVFTNWRAMIGPKGLTADQITYWERALSAVVQTDEWKESLQKNLQERAFLNSKETQQFLESQNAQLTSVLSDLGLAK